MALKSISHASEPIAIESNNRFAHYFPISNWIVRHVWPLMPCFGIFAVLFGQYSVHYALSVMCIWLGIVCIWIDRKQLNYRLITPLQPLAYTLILGLGAGISMVTIDSSEKYKYGYFAMQLVGLLGIPFLLLGYHLMTRNVAAFLFPGVSRRQPYILVRPLIWVGWFCLAIQLARVVVGLVTGMLDRGNASEYTVETPFGWWSYIYAFSRFQVMGNILAALVWRESRTIGRLLLVGIMGVTVFLNFLSGGRGETMRPFFFLLAGCYMFMEFPRLKYEILIIGATIVMYPLVTIMSNYRSTEAYRETDIRDVTRKLGTLKQGLELQAATEEDTGRRFTVAGNAFIGVIDDLIYEMTPSTLAHEGFGRLDDAIWIFVPTMFSRGINRPVVMDDQLVAEPYVGMRLERTAVGVTYTADLYRRWGWIGLPIGLFIYGVLYGLLFRKLHQYYLYQNALWGYMLCGLSFMVWGFSTVLCTLTVWFYDIPKHILVLAVLYLFLKTFISPKPIPGAMALMTKSTDLHADLESPVPVNATPA